MSLLSSMLSRFIITFLQWSKHLLFSWLQSPFTLILETKKIISVTVSTFFPCVCHEVMRTGAMILPFGMLSFKIPFSFSSFTFVKRLFVFFLFAFCHYGGVIWSWQMWSYWYFYIDLCEVIDISTRSIDLVSQSACHFTWCTVHISYISRVMI